MSETSAHGGSHRAKALLFGAIETKAGRALLLNPAVRPLGMTDALGILKEDTSTAPAYLFRLLKAEGETVADLVDACTKADRTVDEGLAAATRRDKGLRTI